MSTNTIRKKLHNYLEVAEDKKVKAIYALFEDEIEQVEITFPDEFKKELEARYDYYKSGGKMVSAADVDKQINKILQKGNKKA